MTRFLVTVHDEDQTTKTNEQKELAIQKALARGLDKPITDFEVIVPTMFMTTGRDEEYWGYQK